MGAGVASPEAVKDTRLSIEMDIGISLSISGSGTTENKSENPPPVLGGSDVGFGSGGFAFEGVEVFSSFCCGFDFGGSGLAGGGPGLGGADAFTAGGGGLEGGAGLGGGGFAGATSRLREISSSSLKLS